MTTQSDEEDKIEEYMREHDISVKGSTAPLPILSFEDGAIPPNILKHVLLQFDKPTPIQSQVRVYGLF